MDLAQPNGAYDHHLLARMIDFFTVEGRSWSRRLWDVGSLLALEELWEAGSWAARRVLSPAALDWQRRTLQVTIGRDVGLGERELRRELNALLGAPVPEPSPARRRLRELIEHARPGYLDRWAVAVRRPEADRPSPERLARMVASHLLDLGYHPSHLLAWAEELAYRQVTALELVGEATRLAQAEQREHQVLVALAAAPRRGLAERIDNWLPSQAVVSWLREHGHDTTGLRVDGGFLYKMLARDPYGAADQARQLLDRMVARSNFLHRRRDIIRPADHLWIDGHSQPVPGAAPARGAGVMSLVHGGHLYQVSGVSPRIDEALELAAPLNRGAPGPALAGAWAAIESLLSHPDDPPEDERSGKAVAADRFAAIVACSWPRAELTALAHRHRPAEPDELSVRLATGRSNRERAQLVADAIVADRGLPDVSRSRHPHSDLAAVQRMRKVLTDPRRELADAVTAFQIALRRLYRTRNIVLHGGSTQSVTLTATLRTSAPLVGAGLDRITNAAMIEGIDPLDLAARAEMALRLVGGETGLSPVELLEPTRDHPPREAGRSTPRPRGASAESGPTRQGTMAGTSALGE